MATIRASCSDCGDVELTTVDVHVRICTHDNSGTYRFLCPICHMATVKSAEARTIDLLVASGVAFTTWDLPSEMFERSGGKPITHDDLLDFHELMAREDWLEQLTEGIDG